MMGGLYTLLLASETVEREGALPWHCSLLWVMKAGKELNCFLHFPHRKTSSSSAIKRNGSLLQAFFSIPQSYTRQPQQVKARKQTPAVSWHLTDIIVRRNQAQLSSFRDAKFSLKPTDVDKPVLAALPHTKPCCRPLTS